MYDFIKYSENTIETATSYIDTDELKSINTFNAMINFNDISSISDSDLEIMLINAAQILDTLVFFAGSKQNDLQRLEFPRDFNYEFHIEDNVKLAQSYICASIANGEIDSILVADSGKQTKREKVDVLEVEYFEGGSTKSDSSFSNNPYLEKLLKPYITSKGFKTIPMYRG